MRRRRRDQGSIARRRIGAQHPREVLAVDGGQHHIEQQYPRPCRLREREGVEARRSRVNREPEVLEDETYRVA